MRRACRLAVLAASIFGDEVLESRFFTPHPRTYPKELTLFEAPETFGGPFVQNDTAGVSGYCGRLDGTEAGTTRGRAFPPLTKRGSRMGPPADVLESRFFTPHPRTYPKELTLFGAPETFGGPFVQNDTAGFRGIAGSRPVTAEESNRGRWRRPEDRNSYGGFRFVSGPLFPGCGACDGKGPTASREHGQRWRR